MTQNRRQFLASLGAVPFIGAAKGKQQVETGKIVAVNRGDFGTLYDAHGKQITRAVRANLKTGRVLRYKYLEPYKEVVHYDAPLRFVEFT
jgi:hypothetical protein